MKINFKTILLTSLSIISLQATYAQNPFWKEIAKHPATLGIEQGSKSFKLGKLNLKILNSSQTLASLKLNDDAEFDYTVDELLDKRDRNKFYHLGDINISLKVKGSDTWEEYSSAKERKPVSPLKAKGKVLMSAILNPTLGNIPIQVIRSWENKNGDLYLKFTLNNNSKDIIEIGSLGIPMIFNNNMDWKHLDTAHMDNVFFDPYIGMDAGYLQVNRLHGNGPSLLVLPQENAGMEAYSPLLSDPTPKSITFEGFHEWMIFSKAHSETYWKNVEQWNKPTSLLLKPGEMKSFTLKFVLAASIKQIEEELITQKRPVAIGAPGYVLPQNNTAKLYIKYPKNIKRIDIYPQNSLEIVPSSKKIKNWESYDIKGKIWGRSRITLVYEDGLKQSIQYKVIKPEQEVVKDLGHFLTTTQWYENPNDLFGRSPSVISYDYETKSHITQEQRAWYAGLSDEAGAASWLAAFMKQLLQPNAEEIAKLKRFSDETLFGRIQHKAGKDQYAVKKSLFYYEPDSLPKGTYSDKINYKTWAAWPKKEADNIGRSYNYPHVAAAHWVLYRLAKNYNHLLNQQDWKTYLERAYFTALAMVEKAPYYAQFGQMEGSIFLLILMDLKKEGLIQEANALELLMKNRALHWKTLAYPFGSEMPWDSTGQEEVYMWSKYFGFDDKAQVTLNAILAYMPTVPHWGYNGSARRYWDFVYGGKLSRIERQLHHYGSALNSIPVLSAYKENPSDFYLLRVGHAGMMGALANVTQDGFGPAAFHSFPSTLANDGISGDYGSGFYGYAVNSGTFIINHPVFGWLSFSGNLNESDDKIEVEITTASKARVFLAEEKLSINLDAGQIKKLTYFKANKEIELELETNNPDSKQTILFLKSDKPYKIEGFTPDLNGKYTVPKSITTLRLVLSN